MRHKHYTIAIKLLLVSICLISSTGLASGSDNGNFNALVEDVGQIWCAGWPGPLWALNDKPVTIVSGDDDTSRPSGLVMAVEYGRGRVIASVVKLWGRYLDIWNDLGIFILDNSMLDQNQLGFIYNYHKLIPPELLAPLCDVQRFISVDSFWGQNPGNLYYLRYRSNIFGSRVEEGSANPFPEDSEPWMVCSFCDVVVHEVNHALDPRVISYEFDRDGKLKERIYTLIKQAVPADIVFGDQDWIDWEATRAVFQEKGFWDGNPSTWDTA